MALFFAISPAAGVAGELKQHRKEPDMAKRENEGKKEKKQKKERKEKRKQYRGLYLNPISVPRARTRACEGRRLACTCTFREAGEAAMEIIDNCFGSIDCDFRIWAWYCRHFDRRRIVDRPTSTPHARSAAKSAVPSPPSKAGFEKNSQRKAVWHERSHDHGLCR